MRWPPEWGGRFCIPARRGSTSGCATVRLLALFSHVLALFSHAPG